MTPEAVIQVGEQALQITVLILAPLLLSALVTGVLIGLFQAATQINEMTLSFIPKLLVQVVVLILAGRWMLRLFVDYTEQLISNIPFLVG